MTIRDELVETERRKLDMETQVLYEELLDKRASRARRETWAQERRVLDFVGDVEELSVADAVETLNEWAAYSKAPITLRLNSPGGTVFDGLMLFDIVRDIRRSGIHVTTYALGFAASMASVLLQAGDHRQISKNTWYMIHEPSSIALGKASDISDEAAMLKRLHRQLVGILAERSSLSQRQIINRCDRKDWWMTAEEAVQFGFADELV